MAAAWLLAALVSLAGCGPTLSSSPLSGTPTANALLSPERTATASPARAIPSAAASPSDRTPTPSPAATASSTPVASRVVLPDTPVEAVLDEFYDTSGADFSPANLGGVEPGDVTARWYVSDDRWVVHYDGLDPEATAPLCPGTSAQTDAGFEHVSNAPTAEGGCDNFDTTRATPPVGVRLCAGEVLYLTEIPSDVEGMLYGSIERSTSGGAFVGLTSAADPSAGQAPQIDLDELGCVTVG